MIKRDPDLKIGPDYMHRWYIIPRNRFFNIYLHKIMRNDDDRALHDHPWWSLSFLLKGEMKEQQLSGYRILPWLFPVIRSAKFAHRLEIIKGPVWTIFITGPRIREWGFHCKNKWVHWRDFTSGDKGETVGKGCGD